METKLETKRPGGSRDCLRSRRFSAPCCVCGERPEWLHMPLKLRGCYCTTCCPCCHETVARTTTSNAR